MVRIVLMRLMLVLMSGVSPTFERWTFRDRRRSSSNRGSEICSREHQREQTTHEFE